MLDISTTTAAEESYPFVKRVNTCREHPSPKEFGLIAVRPCLSTAWLMAQTYKNSHLRLTASRPCTQHREARARAPPKKKEMSNRATHTHHQQASDRSLSWPPNSKQRGGTKGGNKVAVGHGTDAACDYQIRKAKPE